MKTLYTIYNNFAKRLVMSLMVLMTVGVGSVWGAEVTDVIKASDLKATTNNYVDFSGVSKSSDAVYAGQSAKDASGNIQLRSKNSNSGIVSTTSGGKVKSVKINVGSGSNTVDVYGSNTAYTAASDLYGNNKGTKIGSLTATGTIAFNDDYAYVGIRSNNGAIYLSSIEIVWEVGSSCTEPTITTQPTGATYTKGATATALKVVASGDDLTYQWYSNTSNSTSGATKINDATNYTYTPSTSTAGTKYYYCIVSSGSCSTTSKIVSVVVSPTYTVTYNANGATSGTVPTDATKYNGGATVTVKGNSGNLAKTGYTFAGWNTKADGTGNTYAAGTGTFTISSNTTLYAKWKARELTNYRTTCTPPCAMVTITNATPSIGGFSLSINTEAVTSPIENCGQGNLTITIVPYAGYRIKDVSNTTDLSIDDYGTATATYTKNTTIYSEVTLEPREYTITYHLNGGSGVTNTTYTIESEDITLPTPTHEQGLTFAGWYQYEDFTEDPVTVITKGSTGNKQFWAKWEKATPTFAWSAASYTAALEADNTFPTLSNPNSLSVTYTSSNNGVATIDEDGNITLVATGKTTITATGAESTTHKSATTAYTLTVVESNCKWVEVTDNATLEDGDEVVITSQIGGVVYALPNTYGTSTPGVMIVNNIKNNEIPSVSNDIKWTIKKQGELYIFHPNGDLNSWLYCTNSNDGVRVGTNANKTFAIGQNLESITHVATSRSIRIGSTDLGGLVWRCYTTTSNQTLKFYKRECLDASKVWVEGNLTNVTCIPQLPQQLAKDGSITLTFTAADGYVLPNDVTVSYATKTWNKEDGTLTISNPTNNVTVTVEAVKLHTITWMVGSNPVLTEKVANATGVTKTPDTPANGAIGNCANAFRGWSEKSAGSTPQDAAYYDDLCSAADMKSKHTSVTGDETFYAVFATKEGSSETTQMYQLVTSISGGKEYIFATGNSAGSVNGLTCDANSNLTATSLTVITSSGITYIETPASNNVVWNITSSNSSYNAQNKGQSGKYLRCYGTSPNAVIAASAYALYWDGSKGLYGKSNSGSTSYYLYYNTNKWGASSSPSGRVYAFEKKEVTVDNTTYSNYITSCCETPAPTNGTFDDVTGSGNAMSLTLNWEGSAERYHITGGNLAAEGIYTSETSYTVNNLTECEEYIFNVTAYPEDGCESAAIQISAQPFSGAKTVNYNYNGGTGSVTSFTTSCTNQTITLPTATRTGYTFNGWFDAASGGNLVGVAGVEYNPATSSVTLYAQWTKQIYSISFHANGGSGTMANQQADENDKIAKLNANQFTRDGYVFVGWNTKANGTGIAYADQATDITLTGNLTLYAQWAAIVTLNDAGNVTTTHPTTVNGTITLPNGANACDPYEFVGWTAVATGDWNEGINEPALVATTYTPNAPTTLYAVYKIQSEGNANAFKLSFEGGNGKTYYVGEYGSSPYLRGYSNITEADAVTFIRKKMYPNDDTKYYLYLEHLEEYLYCSSGNLYTTSNEPSESQGWVFHTIGDKIQIQAINQEKYLSYSDRDDDRINITTHSTGGQESFNMLSAVTSTYVASPLCNQEIEIIFETGNGNFVDNAPATNPLTVSRGETITLPTCEYPGYEFMGWMKDEQQLDPSDIIGTYYTGDYTVDGVSSTITFYAYYKVIPQEVEFTGKDDVELLMYYYDGTENYYYAVSHAAERGELSSKQNCFNATTWTFTNVGNMQYHIQDETGKYLGAYSDGDNDLILSATPKVWTFTEVNGLWKMVCENSPSRALMYISTGKTFANSAISNEGNGAYSYVTLGICPYPTYTTNPVLSQGFSITNTAMVTSASGQKVKATSALTLETRNIELPCTFTISAPNITFYDNTGAEVTQLTASAASEQFELYFAYKPTAANTMEYPTITIVDDEMKTYTIKNRIYARSLPNTFAIVAKVGNLWYALPSQGLNSTTPPAAYPVEVDNQNDPTAVTAVPANADWSLRGVYEASRSDATKDRYVANGDNLVFVNNASPAMVLNASSSEEENYLLTDAQYANYYETNPGLYEWTPTTTDLEAYQLTNEQRGRTLSVNIATIFGVHAQNKAVEQVRFLPIQNRYTPMAAQVVEWKENSVVVMYNGDPAQTASVSVNGGSAQTTTLSSAQKDIAVYELAANGLATNPTQRLSITIGTEKVILPIPYIISGSKNDIDVLPGSTVAARQDIAKVSDLVILKDATLTAAGTKGNPYKFRNVTVYGGGKLVVPADYGFGVASLTLRAGGITDAGKYDYVYPQFELRGTFTNSAAKINYDYITDYDHWFHLVLPFDGDLGTIKYPTEFYGANVKPNNTGSWQIKRYAGEIRATGDYNAWVDIETEDKTSTTAGQGYIFWGAPKKVSVNGGASTRQKWGIQRITMSVTAPNAMTAENGDKTLTGLSSHKDVPNNSGAVNDQGWNLVGNPYMVNLTTMSEVGLKAGKLVEEIVDGNWTGKWINNGDNLRYLTIPSEHFDTYEAKTVSEAISANALVPGRAFFVQLEGEANGITFAATNRASLMPALLAENSDKPVDIETGIILSNETLQDEVNFWIKDGKTNDYEYNADYPKTPNNNHFNIYGVHTNGDLSWVATGPEYAAESMPIGYQVPAAGTYTLSASETYYSEDLQALYVTDHAMSPELTVDLMNAPYEFSVNQAETNNERFTVSVILKVEEDDNSGGNSGDGNGDENENGNGNGDENGDDTTGVDNTTIHNRPYKFIYKNKIYILHNGVIYNAMSTQIQTINK